MFFFPYKYEIVTKSSYPRGGDYLFFLSNWYTKKKI